MRYQLILSIASAVFLFGCSNQPEVNIAIPPGTPAPIKSTVEQAWPKIKATCPGVQKYWSDLQFAGIEDNLSYAPENAKRIEIKFSVSKSPAKIPAGYRTAGHTCFFSVSQDGKKLSISKSPCASLCTDTEQSAEYSKDL